MELMQKYIDNVYSLNGIYIMQIPSSMPFKQAKEMADKWKNRFGQGRPLMVIPEEVDIQYMESFDTSIAIRMLTNGYRLKRSSELGVKYIWSDRLKRKEEGQRWKNYTLTDADLLARDWQLVREDLQL
ncbi:hypothetical protein TCA2_4507 [Paenibacillus sp. TCA20]|uniref:hypothetical protein n=1 Tax=Paenibacillus sp. TCA20 TaxID=1499968 RepID=UPI0004D4FE64|nr:hypothetical protein [Paenibacillus sp. TCA20]GAK42015.1 hypothetical protein TCA2_4507 [Paenibacillus sp. TCA20]